MKKNLWNMKYIWEINKDDDNYIFEIINWDNDNEK